MDPTIPNILSKMIQGESVSDSDEILGLEKLFIDIRKALQRANITFQNVSLDEVTGILTNTVILKHSIETFENYLRIEVHDKELAIYPKGHFISLKGDRVLCRLLKNLDNGASIVRIMQNIDPYQFRQEILIPSCDFVFEKANKKAKKK